MVASPLINVIIYQDRAYRVLFIGIVRLANTSNKIGVSRGAADGSKANLISTSIEEARAVYSVCHYVFRGVPAPHIRW